MVDSKKLAGTAGLAEKDLTQWFDASEQIPVRNGWYDVQYAGSPSIYRQYWDNVRWLTQITTNKFQTSTMGTWFGDQWRGLRKPAK